MKTLLSSRSVHWALALAAGLAVSAVNAHAQITPTVAPVAASAQITAQPMTGGIYTYTVALDNTGSSSLETFWFAWNTDGHDYMTAGPTSISQPSGWTDSVTIDYNPSYGYNYGIQFTTSTTPLASGGTLDFSFDSTLTPTQMAGNNPTFGVPVATSFVSTGPGFTGTDYGPFTARVVPEPCSLALFAVGSCGLWIVRGRERR